MVGGSDVAPAMAMVFSQGVCPIGISPAAGSLRLEVPRASPVASPVASGGPLVDQPPRKKKRKLPWGPAQPGGTAITGPHGAAVGAHGNEIEPAVTKAISEVPNLVTGAHSGEQSPVATLSSDVCKLATSAQPEEKPAVGVLSSEVTDVAAEVHGDEREPAVAAICPLCLVEHGMGVGGEAEGLDVVDATAKQALIQVDLGAVAPAPAPRVGSIEPTLAPPPRAALDVLPPGRPSTFTELVPPVAVFADAPAVAGDTAKPDVDDDGDGDSDGAVLAVLTNPTIAGDLVAFLDELGTTGQWIGVSAFILFSLAFRVQVHIWFGTKRSNVLHMDEHCYWDVMITDEYIPKHAPYDVIACEIRSNGDETEVCLIRDDTGYGMNHWIGGVYGAIYP